MTWFQSGGAGVTIHNNLSDIELVSGSADYGHIDDNIYNNTFAFSNYYVNSGATVSSPDGTFLKPFTSLSACMTAIGVPTSTADARRIIVVHIASGPYDENVLIPQQRLITFMCYGTVIIGDGAADDLFNSTTPRNLTVQNTATGEQPDSPSRPAFSVQVVAGETTSTHSAYNFGNLIISGDLQFNHIDGNSTTHETYLSSVKVQGNVTANANELGSIHNIQIEKCFFDNTFNLANVNINICNSSEFDGPVTASGVCRFVNCEISGGLTAAMVDFYPPNGFYDCEVNGGTWTITNVVVNETTRQQIVDNAITVTGGYVVTAKTAFTDFQNSFTVQQNFTGPVIIGDVSNYAQIKTDGEINLYGTARVKNYGKIFTSQELQRGLVPPASGTLGNYAYETYTINDDSIFNFHSLNRREPGTDIEIVIKWAIDEAYATNNGEIQWQIEWASLPANNTEAVDAPVTSGTVKSGDVDIPANAKYLTETILTIPGTGIGQDEEIGIILKRIVIDDGTDPVAEPGIICIGVQHITNKLGTAT